MGKQLEGIVFMAGLFTIQVGAVLAIHHFITRNEKPKGRGT